MTVKTRDRQRKRRGLTDKDTERYMCDYQMNREGARIVPDKQRERERKREREKQTDTQTDRLRHRNKDPCL